MLGGRRALIERAIASVQNQAGVETRTRLIVNGAEADRDLVADLRGNPSLEVIHVPNRGIPDALRAGQAMATTPYLAALDDDDELLPGALAARIAHLETHSDLDAVVSNGIVRSASGDRLRRERFAEIAADPLRAMIRGNWLLPGSWLCRNDRIGAWLLEGMPKYLECTWIGLRLATGAKVGFLEQPTVIWYDETPGGTHRSLEYTLGQVDAIRQLMTLPLPPDVMAYLEANITSACHESAERLLFADHAWGAAWRWHLRSLRGAGGLRYLPFTRKFIWPSLWTTRGDRPS